MKCELKYSYNKNEKFAIYVKFVIQFEKKNIRIPNEGFAQP